jgi:hypothetical protein
MRQAHFRLLVALSLALIQFHRANAASLESGFREPPDAARPWVYWFVMDGNFTREGITADFEAMKRAGIGGVIFMEVNVGIPRGPVEFMSPAWRQLFKHAVAEAERLGLQITLNAGPGWTGSGGPWVKPAESMQHLVSSAVEMKGPASFDAVLPRPTPRPPYFGTDGLPPALLKAQNEFYVDLAVLAVPKTDPAKTISDIDEKALFLRHPYSSRPGTKASLPSPADFPALSSDAVIPTNQVIDLSSQLGPDGRLTWNVPEGKWTLLRFGRTSTGANTRPAPTPGLGLECDKFDPAALDAHFNAFIGTLLREIGPRKKTSSWGWKMLHIDSWEMGAQNWTASFRDEFRRRRGYDPLPYLPVTTGRVVGSLEISERFLWDLRQTAQELTIQNHAVHLKELGKRHGFGLSIEPYDMNPCADMSLGAVADVPMCEFWLYGFNTFFSVIEAASIAHTCGRPIVAAESFTSTDDERWLAHPASMKTLGDWAFCSGVNRIVFHRYQHQPRLDQWPGMTMGPYGVHWERTQTWWEMSQAYHRYLARCQFLLRQGLPVADVCYLVAEGAPQVFRPPTSATRGTPPDRLGYNFDGIAPETLLERMSVRRGNLVLPEGMSYRLLVLPQRETMTPKLLRKVRDLVNAGATVIGPRPRKSPSLSDYPTCDEEVRSIAEELWGQQTGPASKPSHSQALEHSFGKGRLIECPPPPSTTGDAEPEQYGEFRQVETVLRQMSVKPDFVCDAPLRYIHRRTRSQEIYFLANGTDHEVSTTGTFRVSGKTPSLWDPITGQTRPLVQFTRQDDAISIPLRFESAQSYFIVFSKSRRQSSKRTEDFPRPQSVGELTGPWEVQFDPRWGGPVAPVAFAQLDDWAGRAEDSIRYYSGTAVYRVRFAPPESLRLDLSSKLLLDLGSVKNIARVRLNGHDLGVVWCAPWRVDISRAIRPGENQLEITVANLWPNRLIGDQLLPPEKRFTSTTWNPFKKDSPLQPSGLLGPVKLLLETPPIAREP